MLSYAQPEHAVPEFRSGRHFGLTPAQIHLYVPQVRSATDIYQLPAGPLEACRWVELRRVNRRPVRVGLRGRWSGPPRQARPCPARLRARSPTLNVTQTGSVAHGRLAP